MDFDLKRAADALERIAKALEKMAGPDAPPPPPAPAPVPYPSCPPPVVPPYVVTTGTVAVDPASQGTVTYWTIKPGTGFGHGILGNP